MTFTIIKDEVFRQHVAVNGERRALVGYCLHEGRPMLRIRNHALEQSVILDLNTARKVAELMLHALKTKTKPGKDNFRPFCPGFIKKRD